MKPKKILELLWTAMICIFVLKGFLSDFGIGTPFKQESIYSFAYLAFAMSGWMFFDKYIFHAKDDENTTSS